MVNDLNFRQRKILFCSVLAALAACSGCRTMRSGNNPANVTDARLLTQNGMNAMHYGYTQQAESLLSQAVDKCPSDQRIRHHLASAMVKQGKYDEAIAQLETAVQQSCQDARLFVDLGELYLIKGDATKAAWNAEKALEANRQNSEAWVLRGRCHEAQRDVPSALADYHRASGLDDANPEVQLYIAKAYRQMGRPLEALTALEVYNESFPSEQIPTEALLLTANTLTELKQFPSAKQALQRASQRPDATPEIWLALSKLQFNAGETISAIGTAREAMLVFPENKELVNWTVSLETTPPAIQQTAARARAPRY